ncbi:MAG: metal-dependent hydrolase [Myxococcaceae bacterium]|nr:metal-dependent hydrolase [Myxococcaceae bacterium]MCI0671751.1 metal-dependent hydrolase [Myxococcaceae bacterium]
MASIGHIAVGMAAARGLLPAGVQRRRLVGAMAALSLLSLLPDADVVAFALGIPYGAPWGHRGASHSLAVAVLVGTAAAIAAPRVGLARARAGLVVLGVVASHGLLDALTDGGLGAALLWPFSHARLFAPVRPLPVAPIGSGMLSPRGLFVVAVELFAFLPLWLYALWPRRAALRRTA